MDDRRKVPRKRVLKEGKIVYADGLRVLDCTIRDITPEGAKIVLGGATSLPPEFRILTVASNTIVPVRLEWQRGLSAGVAFAGPEEPVTAKKA